MLVQFTVFSVSKDVEK